MNDDQSPLTTLISCVECAKTMRIEKIDPDGKGRDMIQYRCDYCGRIERLRLIRRTWPSARQTRGKHKADFSAAVRAAMARYGPVHMVKLTEMREITPYL